MIKKDNHGSQIKKENGTPADAGVTVLFEKNVLTINTVMPAKAGIPFGLLT